LSESVWPSKNLTVVVGEDQVSLALGFGGVLVLAIIQADEVEFADDFMA
jgi:hypothetical protein